MPKKTDLLSNLYQHARTGKIYFRQKIKGEDIHYPVGTDDVVWANKNITEIRHRALNEYFKLVKKENYKKTISLRGLQQKWLKAKRSSVSSVTYKTYNQKTSQYIKTGLPTGRAISTINSTRRQVNAMIRWGIKNGYKELSVLEGDTDTEPRIRVLSSVELHSIFAIVRPVDLNHAFQFAYYTGTRRKEFNSPDIDKLREGYMEVIQKGGYRRVVKLNKQAQNILNERKEMGLPIFWSYTVDHLTKYFKIWAKRAGIRGVQLHDLRRTFGWDLIVQGVPIFEVSKLLGHANVKVTQKHYSPLMVQHVREFKLTGWTKE
jgi:integrase